MRFYVQQLHTNGRLSSITRLTLYESKDTEVWGRPQTAYESRSISANFFTPQKAQFLKSFHTAMLFHIKCFSSGNAKAIHVSIFSRNVLTFVSKHFF